MLPQPNPSLSLIVNYQSFTIIMLALNYLAISLASFIAVAGLPTPVHQRDLSKLTYLGSYRSGPVHHSVRDKRSTAQESFYFRSQNAAGWATAATDCEAFLGPDASLLYIETQEELGNITRFIQSSDDTGSSYWIGGKFDPEQDTFVWANGAEIGPWAPWLEGHPNTRTLVTRVAAVTVDDVRFRTQFSTESTRYLCELRSGLEEEGALPCYNDNDLVVVVDSSGSIGEEHYRIALEFTSRLAIAWADNPQNRLSFIIYSTNAQRIISLDDKLSVQEIRDTVYSTPYLTGGTASHLGLDLAFQQIQQSNRTTVPQNLVFLTDGASDSSLSTKSSAERVRDAGIRAFAVGIGENVNKDELLAIAGDKPEHVFNTDGFDDLLKLLLPVSKIVCEESK